MGNAIRLKKRGSEIIKSEIQNSSSASITNYSFTIHNSTAHNSFIKSEESKSNTETCLLTWDRLQNIYSKIIENTSDSFEIESEVITAMSNMFDRIANNLSQMSYNFYSSLLDTDEVYGGHFEECANRNFNSHTKNLNAKDKVINHIFSALYVHKKILNELADGNYTEVNNVLNLIGVSHALMKVAPDYFKVADIMLGKYFINNRFLTEQNAEYAVIYFNYITSKIISYMRLQQSRDNLIYYNKTISEDKHSMITRENYRNMKKWYAFVNNMQEKINKIKETETFPQNQPIEEIPSIISPVPTEILAQDAFLIKYFVKKKKD